ncbi:hypothetical protein BZG84_15855 [Salinivibrio sp. PR932]|uniref:hypothetical protein n=1 Tax=Salinivibrio sp. PR932 TaxID=1909492 RepID=UPI000988A9E4|nr:hypothetical protein [Salinivibrio sp. PR932]OOF13387.1 hypothetical protein BZG84_15855 [Salinivibrio sp. PR932]
MISYLFFSGKNNEVKELFSKLSVNSINVNFEVKETVAKISANGKWGALVFSDTVGEIEKRFIINNKGAMAINGPCSSFFKDGVGACDLFDALISEGRDRLFDKLGGAFNLASISLKYGLMGFSDFTGSYPLYEAHKNGVNFLSNSVHMLKYVLNTDVSLTSLSYLIGHSNVFFDETVWSGIRLINPSCFYSAMLGSSSKGECERFNNTIWPIGDSTDGFKHPDDVDWKSLVDVAAENLANFCAKDESIRLSLTGGKDSRLILSIALYAGLKDVITTFTKGPLNSPEIECAKNVAKVAGVKHKAIYPSQTQDARKESDKIWRMLIQSNTRFAGGLCLWDGVSGSVSGLSYDITGFGGELYRGPGGHAKQFKNLEFINDNKTDLLNRWINYHQKIDPLGILTPEMRNFQVESISNWIDKNAHYRLDILPEKFYIENRLTHWNGLLAQQVPGRVKLMPLLSTHIARQTFSLSPLFRNAETTHFNMMKVAAPNLLELPFLNDSWSSLLVDHYGLKQQKQFKSGASPRSIQSWQWDFVEKEKVKIEKYLKEAYSKTEISRIFDVEKVVCFVRKGIYRNVVEVKTVMSCLSIALTMLRITEYPNDKVS